MKGEGVPRFWISTSRLAVIVLNMCPRTLQLKFQMAFTHNKLLSWLKTASFRSHANPNLLSSIVSVSMLIMMPYALLGAHIVYGRSMFTYFINDNSLFLE